MHYPKLYTTTVGLQTILANSENSLFSKAIFDWMDVFTPLNENAIEELSVDEYLWPFVLSRYGNEGGDSRKIADLPLDSAEYVDGQDILDISTDYFISNRTPEDCETLRNQTGVFVISDQDVSPLKVLFQFATDLPSEGALYAANISLGTEDGWDHVLNGHYPFRAKSFPTNAAVLYDKYICNDSVGSVARQLINLCKALVHPHLQERFQLTLVTSLKDSKLNLVHNGPKIPGQFFNDLKSRVESALGQKIDLQIILHNCKGLHDRYLHTGYYTLLSGIGYSPFDRDDPAILNARSTFLFQGNLAFIKIENERGGLHFAQENHSIICKEKKNFVHWKSGDVIPTTPYYFGDCENRLFSHF